MSPRIGSAYWIAASVLGMAASLVIAAPRASAQAETGWVGKRVITHYGTVLRVGSQVVDDEKRSNTFAITGRDKRQFRVYRVRQVNGPWLWLVAEKEHVSGWAKVESVILYDQAIDYYTGLIRANPSSSLFTTRGTIWKEKGEFDIALGDFNEAIRLDPASDVAWLNRGNAWSDKKEYDKAIADYAEAIRLDPKDALAYHNRGNAWADKKEYDKAIADYAEAIRLDPKDASAYNGRAWLWATAADPKVRDGKKAVESATKACELSEWKAANDLDTLAASYAEDGDFQAAVKWQEKAQSLVTEETLKKEFLDRLDLYRANRPYREDDKSAGPSS